ncbi:hypothetical protein F0P96_08480 [Hymenobacter busanensis]|uniref:Uncharacterized protein n=1 Tax=Hymenobacter busanensis TaxID=2607656 RepID=A0A7L4ZZW4_9BACT|nr:hypothetical protein [Hymenobacter busanensis]KAA9333011.1 hypothetical protein F0P96_08480 [Hymenobacter busanensis]QHJ08315.1 hypothetical protein GUY19_13850 [Hymenobacter busanensis]
MSTPITPAGAPAPAPAKAVRRAAQLPAKAVPLGMLATNVAGKWLASALPDLLWLSKADFAAQAADFVAHSSQADAAGDQRAPQAKRLKALDQLLAKGLPFVKAYLAEEFDDDEAYYGEFGIGKEGGKWTLPSARPERVKALQKLQDALVKHKFDKKKYGTAYWAPLATEYQQLVKKSLDTSGERSQKVDAKDQGEAQVRKALRAIIHHVKANFPDTWEAELRGMGFQKESFGG